MFYRTSRDGPDADLEGKYLSPAGSIFYNPPGHGGQFFKVLLGAGTTLELRQDVAQCPVS